MSQVTSQKNTPAEPGTSDPRTGALTDAEREAVRFCAVLMDMGSRPDVAITLRGLLERMRVENE